MRGGLLGEHTIYLRLEILGGLSLKVKGQDADLVNDPRENSKPRKEEPRSGSGEASYLGWKDGKPTGCTLGGQHPGRRSKAAVKHTVGCSWETHPRDPHRAPPLAFALQVNPQPLSRQSRLTLGHLLM